MSSSVSAEVPLTPSLSAATTVSTSSSAESGVLTSITALSSSSPSAPHGHPSSTLLKPHLPDSKFFQVFEDVLPRVSVSEFFEGFKDELPPVPENANRCNDTACTQKIKYSTSVCNVL
ncbi:hypothetical protein ATANTOWER_012142 [Ataeniobius toweri]|uniref:Uncharacterized protein n=1 Tax=Ataeniobius toweri TaxID=208326 RepID=A0ABU7C098_9TELE|nr:hypothetical protein [Ataeniobius toweri]